MDPWNISETGDLSGLGTWFTDRLADRLERSSLEISREQYEAAKDLVGPRYRATAADLIDVAGETRDRGDDRRAAALDRAGETQHRFADGVHRFHETYRNEYLPAKQRGDAEAARRHAKTLVRTSNQVARDAAALRTAYRDVENGSGPGLGDASTRIRSVAAAVSRTSDAVRSTEELVNATLTLDTASRNASLTDPLRVAGRVTLLDDPVPDAAVRVTTGDHRVTTRTDGNGRFSASLRPYRAPPGETRVTARFLPRNHSPVLGDSDSATYRLRTTSATLTLHRSPDAAAYGDAVETTGRLEADGHPVPWIPVEVAVGDVRVGAAETGPDGSFSLSPPLPAAAPSGTGTLRVAPDLSGTALAASPATAPIRVTTTATDLSVRVTGGHDVAVRGTLVTESGKPVPGQEVALRCADANATVETTSGGTFRSPLHPERTGTLNVTASFPGTGNLGPSETTAPVTVTRPTAAAEPPVDVDPVAAAAAAALLLVALGAAASLLRHDAEDDTPEPAPREPEGETTEDGAKRDLLREARTKRRYARMDEAGELAYAAARRGLGGPGGTHWEFYRSHARNGLPEDAAEDLLRLTTLYEAAAFAPRHLSPDEADEALELGERFAEGSR